MSNLALLETLVYLQELDTCQYTGSFFFFLFQSGVLKMGHFSSFLLKFDPQVDRCLGVSQPISR